MTNHKNRLSKLEAQNRPPRRIVVRYAEQTDPAELEALRKDENIILLVVTYEDRKPQDEVIG
jgi:hypothetical protein